MKIEKIQVERMKRFGEPNFEIVTTDEWRMIVDGVVIATMEINVDTNLYDVRVNGIGYEWRIDEVIDETDAINTFVQCVIETLEGEISWCESKLADIKGESWIE